jgi:hypothetical protein
MTRTQTVLMAIVVAGALAGCPKDEAGSMGDKAHPRPDASMANVTKVETSVPWGKHVACADLLDPVKVAAGIGEAEVTITDTTAGGEKEATSICSVKKTGKALSQKQQDALYQKNGFKIGVQPGDEICQLKLYCSYPYDMAESRKTMEGQGQQCATGDIGDLTCVQQIQAGADYRYIVSVLDPDSQCRLVVSPTTITELPPMKACAKTFADVISKDQLKVQP